MSDVDTVSFGDVLRQYRLAAGLTQEELAERAHLSARGISDLERGARSSPRKDTVLLLADALGLSGEERSSFAEAAHVARYIASVPPPSAQSADRGRPTDEADAAQGPEVRRRERVPEIPRPAMTGLVALLVLALATGIGTVTLRSLRPTGAASETHTQLAFASWGPVRPLPDTSPLHLTNALRVAVDHQGNMYVTEGSALYSDNALASHRADILKLSPTGRVLARWGHYGKRPGEFNAPAGIAVDSHGNVYVADFGNNRIQKLSPSGKVLAVWGSSGTSRGQFNLPLGLTVDSHDNVYVADYLNNRVQKLSPSGKVLAVWGSSCGTAPGQFCNPFDVSISTAGDIYVADFGNNRIQRLSPTGRFLDMWPMPGPRSLDRDQRVPPCPSSVAVDARGNVYVLRHASTLVDIFSASGKLLNAWDEGPRSTSHLTGFAFDPHGRLIVVSGDGLYRDSPDGRSTASFPIGTQRLSAGFDQPSLVATGPHGTVYLVSGSAHKTVEGLSRSGGPLATWEPRVPNSGSTYDFTGAAVDTHRNVFLTDSLSQQILKLSSTGRLLRRWGAANGPEQLVAPDGVAVDGRGKVYVADSDSNQVDVFSSTGTPLAHWGYYGTGPGQFDGPTGVAVDREGNVYVADTGNGRIQKLSPHGKFLAAWGADGAQSAPFDDVVSLAVDRKGDVYTVDALRNEVTKFSPSGIVSARWDRTNDGVLFRRPLSVAVDDRGAVYVADTGNDRVVKLMQ